MQSNSFLNGLKVGKAARVMINFCRRIRHQMLVKAGKSKLRRNLLNMLFFGMIILLTTFLASILYFLIGVAGPVIILMILLALPGAYSSTGHDDGDYYIFNDGYRDGPEGYGYYSGGYKIDD